MAVGVNLNYKYQSRIWAKILKLLGMKTMGRGRQKFKRRLCYKTGVPANNTAADNPNAKYDILYDITNNDLYICTAFSADASATTWVKWSD